MKNIFTIAILQRLSASVQTCAAAVLKFSAEPWFVLPFGETLTNWINSYVFPHCKHLIPKINDLI